MSEKDDECAPFIFPYFEVAQVCHTKHFISPPLCIYIIYIYVSVCMNEYVSLSTHETTE